MRHHENGVSPLSIKVKANKIVLFLALSGVAFLVGCSDKAASRSAVVQPYQAAVPGRFITNEVQNAVLAQLPDDAQLLVVGRRQYTKGQFFAEMTNYFALVRAAAPSAEDAASAIRNSEKAIGPSLIARFVSRSVYAQEADLEGLKPSPEDVAAVAFTVSNECRMAKISFEKYAEFFPGGMPALKSRMAEDAKIQAFFRVAFSNALEVTSNEVETLHADLVKLNEGCKRTNEIYKAEVNAFRQRIVREKLVFTGDEEKDAKVLPKGYVAEVFENAPPSSFEDEETVPALLRVAALGEWQLPIELENTIDLYMITNVIAKTVQTPTLYSGFRVYREKDHGYLVPTKAELYRDIRERRNVAVVGPMTERLTEKFGAVFPYGFIWNQLAQPPRKIKGVKK